MLIESVISRIIIAAITPLLQKAAFAIYAGLQTIALVLCVMFRFGRLVRKFILIRVTTNGGSAIVKKLLRQ